MKITFLGATHEVTGSCTLIEVGKTRLIVDYGMEQGRDVFVNEPLPLSPADIDFVLLTHAHIDHSGNLPLLYKNGFRGTVYATEATCNLCDIMLRDCAHIQMTEAEYKSRKSRRRGGEEVLPVYDMEDATGVLGHFRPCDYGERIQISEEVSVRFTDVGHLLGSACIELWLSDGGEEKKLVFSGDIGNTDQPILRDPARLHEADYVIMESTYGDRSHGEKPDYIGALAEIIQRAFDRGGNVVIPAFAVGRTQEMLYFIREIKERGLVKGHDGFHVYLDSPLAVEATGIFLQCDHSFLDDEARALVERGVNPLQFPGLRTSVSVDESKAINFDMEPKVIISASGMCEAGRIRHHLKHNLWRAECLILFVGYQAEGTLGRIISEGAETVRLFGEEIAVRAEIAWLPGVSAHADREGLIDWLEGFSPRPSQVFVNHGDDEVCAAFAAELRDTLGYKALAPFSGTSFDLLRGELVRLTEGQPVPEKPTAEQGRRRKVSDAFHKLCLAAENLLSAARSCEGRSNKELRGYTQQIENIMRQMRK